MANFRRGFLTQPDMENSRTSERAAFVQFWVNVEILVRTAHGLQK
jgi:hypothetical protein